MYIAYLDEFGHVGPYIGRSHPVHNQSPLFGLGGLLLPADEVRAFASWFYKSKCSLLRWELERSGKHPALWEKKGAALYTLTNIEKYPELRKFTSRFLNRIHCCGGSVVYCGLSKQATVDAHKPQRLYLSVFREMLARLNALCDHAQPSEALMVVMDEHPDRAAIVEAAGKAMFARTKPHRCLIEPPFEVESHRYQTVQAADWICGLLGRIGAYQVAADQYGDWLPFEARFGAHLRQISVCSQIRGDLRIQTTTLIHEAANSER